jgi:xanthine dehydrogenase YagR molybdenum-binding subunit
MSIIADAARAALKKAIALAPDSWMPGGGPDPLITHKHGLIGSQIPRVDGPLKYGVRRVSRQNSPLPT